MTGPTQDVILCTNNLKTKQRLRHVNSTNKPEKWHSAEYLKIKTQSQFQNGMQLGCCEKCKYKLIAIA